MKAQVVALFLLAGIDFLINSDRVENRIVPEQFHNIGKEKYMAGDAFNAEEYFTKKPSMREIILCFLGLHNWLYAPYCVEISTRHICTNGCKSWSDHSGRVFKEMGSRFGWQRH